MSCEIDNKILLVLILIILVILIILTLYQFMQQQEKMENFNRQQINQPQPLQLQQLPQSQPQLQQPLVKPLQLFTPPALLPDNVMQYDYRKAFDPLLDPTRRVPRHELPTLPFKRLIDFPTRGFPDNFTQTGILVSDQKCKHKNNNDNKILRLFSRQEFPGSNKYEYYTSVSSGNDQIKIPIGRRRNDELYDGDDVYIEELGQKYRVKLLSYDAPRYYPDIIW